MRDGFHVIDADRHVLEPFELWQEYLPPEHRKSAPYLSVDEHTGWPLPMLDGSPIWNPIPSKAQAGLAEGAEARGRELASAHSAQGQLRAMDAVGVDIAVLFPTFAGYLAGHDGLEPERARAFTLAYNQWLADLCRVAPNRLKAAWLIAPHDPDALAHDVQLACQRGASALVMRPNPIGGRHPGDRAYASFWAACAKLRMPVVFHEGTHARAPTAGADRFRTRFALHACSHPMEQMMAFLALLEGGVFEDNPELGVAFMEAGCGWVPFWLSRLDSIAHPSHGPEVAAAVRQAPSTYFHRQCFVGFEPDEAHFEDLSEQIGRSRLLFGTDFPHLDHDADVVGRTLSWSSALGKADMRALLSENAQAFFRI